MFYLIYCNMIYEDQSKSYESNLFNSDEQLTKFSQFN